MCLDFQGSPQQSTSAGQGRKVTATLVIEFKAPIYVKEEVLHISGGAEQIDLLNGLIAYRNASDHAGSLAIFQYKNC